MAGETMRFRNPAGHAGLLHNLVSLLNSLVGFLESRLSLFAAESKTALVHILVLVACLAAATFLAIGALWLGAGRRRFLVYVIAGVGCIELLVYARYTCPSFDAAVHLRAGKLAGPAAGAVPAGEEEVERPVLIGPREVADPVAGG